MRILQLCNRVPFPPHDGGAIAMINMTKGFYQLGHELHLLCLNTKKHHVETNSLPGLFGNLASFEAIDINTDVSLIGAAFNLILSRQSYNISRFYNREFEKALVQKLQAHEFDIIHIEGLHMCLYFDTIRRHSIAKICLRAHNLEYMIWERLAENERNPVKHYYLKTLASRLWKFEMKAVRKVDALVPITEIDAGTFREMAPDTPLFVSPTGLDMDGYKINRANQEWPGIFHLGALNWMPNVEAIQWFLKEVWTKVHQEFPNLSFYVAGRDCPDWLNSLEKVGVRKIGEVDSAIDFMNSKGIMVVPLLSGSGMRIKIIEGMALGKTIISTSVGAEGIAYTHQENILIADDPDAFFFAMKKCINNPDFARKIGNNARKLAEKEYDNMVLVEALTGFYENLSAGR